MPRILNDVKVPLDEDLADRLAWMAPDHGPYRILRQSVDARQRHSPHFVYSIEIADRGEELRVAQFHLERVSPPSGERPIIVGSGPAGLFAALRLVERGIPCLLLERGSDTVNRLRGITKFWRYGELDRRNNVCYGEGGAGLYSDGKLITRIKSPHIPYVMNRLVQFGAPEEIQWLSNPHVGSDRIRRVIPLLRAYLLANAFNVQLAAIGETIQHRRSTDVLHNRRLNPDDQFDSLLGADFGHEEHHHQRHHRRLRLPDERRIQRHLPDPGPDSNHNSGVRHVLHDAECHNCGYGQRSDDLLHHQRNNPHHFIHLVSESVLVVGFDHDHRQGHSFRRRVCGQQRSRCDVHDCGGHADVLSGFGYVLFHTGECDHIGHDQRRDNLLLDHGISDDFLAVLHESLQCSDLDYNDDPGYGAREWHLPKRYRGCNLHDCRE